MPKFFVESEQVENDLVQVFGKDVNHIKNVLRKKVGDEIEICDASKAKDYLCEILSLNEETVVCQINEKLIKNSDSSIKVSILQGLPKADKMELVIQKSVELGVYDITPVDMKRCIVKIKDKDKKNERWQKISEVAAKQCMRNIIPKINEISSIKNICNLCDEYDIVIVAYENENNNTLKKELLNIKKIYEENIDKNSDNEFKIAVLIGPEGGIDDSEISMLKKAGAKIVTLGKRILRTETVAFNILSIIMYEFE